MSLRSFAIVLLAAAAFASCKKSKNTTVSTNQIILATPKVSGKLITLSWSKPTNTSVYNGYTIYKTTDTTLSQGTTFFSVDMNATSFTDTLSLTPYVQYYIVAYSNSSALATVSSNKQTYARTDVNFLSIYPSNVLYDKSADRMYLFSASGDIISYDVANNKMIKKISTNATVGYCDMGTYNGRKELYVPRTDGWVFIYDAATLDQIDQVNFSNVSVSGVAYNNGILYVTTGYSSYGAYNMAYDRGTKAAITQTQTINSTNGLLKLIPGSTTEFFGIDGGYDVTYYKFTGGGVLVSQQANYLSSYSLSPTIFEVYPDGSKFISSSTGVIVGKDLKYVASLPYGNASFTSFDFDNSAKLIYAGTNQKTVQAYSMDNYQLTKTINTEGYPVKVFYNNGKVISVSTNTSYAYGYYGTTGYYTVIEQL